MTAQATNLATLRNPPTVAPAPDLHVDFFSRNGFELACRIAKAYASSDAVPSAFRSQIEKKEKVNGVSQTITVENPAALGNCLVAIEVSNSVGLSITSVMQNADVINGKLRWSSKFQIGAVNSSRRFSPLRFNLKNLGRIKASYREKQGGTRPKADSTSSSARSKSTIGSAWHGRTSWIAAASQHQKSFNRFRSA